MAAGAALNLVPFIASQWQVLAIPGYDFNVALGADLNADHAQSGSDHSLDGSGEISLPKSA